MGGDHVRQMQTARGAAHVEQTRGWTGAIGPWAWIEDEGSFMPEREGSWHDVMIHTE